MRPTRVLFLWARYSGYMASCWRQLSNHSDIDVNVIALSSSPGDASDPHFDASILDGISVRLIEESDALDRDRLHALLPKETPDVVVVSGWAFPGYLAAIRSGALSEARVILCSDNQIKHTWRQTFGAHKIRWLLRRASLVFVPGESGYQLMRSWHVPPEKIVKGLYGVDESSLSPCVNMRTEQQWPKNFIFTGRYCKRKGVDLLLKAYSKYRSRVAKPWGLVCCGRGELGEMLDGQPGVVDQGFVQPSDLACQLAHASAFVLASRSDAWPLSLVEAALSGLPIICTSVCGSAAELTRDLYSGRVVPPSDVNSLASAMEWVHERESDLSELGRRSRELGLAYTAHAWAERWQHALQRIGLDIHSHE